MSVPLMESIAANLELLDRPDRKQFLEFVEVEARVAADRQGSRVSHFLRTLPEALGLR